jgi:hypothetical protein
MFPSSISPSHRTPDDNLRWASELARLLILVVSLMPPGLLVAADEVIE